MKFVRLALVASLLASSTLIPTLAQAKSVKYSCVAPDPTQPWVLVCTPISRP